MPDLGIRLEDRPDGTWIIKDMSADEQQEVSDHPTHGLKWEAAWGSPGWKDDRSVRLTSKCCSCCMISKAWQACQPSCASMDAWEHEILSGICMQPQNGCSSKPSDTQS